MNQVQVLRIMLRTAHFRTSWLQTKCVGGSLRVLEMKRSENQFNFNSRNVSTVVLLMLHRTVFNCTLE